MRQMSSFAGVDNQTYISERIADADATVIVAAMCSAVQRWSRCSARALPGFCNDFSSTCASCRSREVD